MHPSTHGRKIPENPGKFILDPVGAFTENPGKFVGIICFKSPYVYDYELNIKDNAFNEFSLIRRHYGLYKMAKDQK